MVLSDQHRVDPVVASNGGTDAVAAWETNTGAPVEVRTRRDAGAWTPVRTIGGRNSRDPAVAMTPKGTALVALQTYDDTHTARIGTTTDADDWAAMRYVSSAGVTARAPAVGVDASGRAVVVWQADHSPTSVEVQMAQESADGTWSRPRTLSGPGRMGTPRLAVAPDGSAVVAWAAQTGRHSRVWGARREATGRWTAAQPLSPVLRHATDPGVAALRDGVAAVAWAEETDGGSVLMSVARMGDGKWTEPETVDRANELPREMSRPGRVEMAPAAVFSPDGRLSVSWAAGRGSTTGVFSATTGADGRFTSWPLSAPGRQAGGVTLARAPGGATVTGWEEIDGGLLRVRVQTDRGACRDIAPPVGESAGVRIAGGTAPVAVYIDLNRGRIMGTDLT